MKPAPVDPILALPQAHGWPPVSGRLRVEPEDFLVEELLSYGPSGEGEHAFLRVRKRQRNTEEVARLLARHAGVPLAAVGYAGLKDRQAVTVQSFSVHLPGQPGPDWSALDDEHVQVIDAQRHSRKIRRGSLRGNRFRLRLRDIAGERDALGERVVRVIDRGVPNYFGPQRFGHQGGNLVHAHALLMDELKRVPRQQKSLWLSAARSHLFNQVLAERVKAGSWDRPLAGEVMLLEGSQRQFPAPRVDAELVERMAAFDIHPSGPLCGRASRSLAPGDEVAELERRVLADWQDWQAGLERFGLDAMRRSLRLPVQELVWDWEDGDLHLDFSLMAGSYATAVVRELVEVV